MFRNRRVTTFKKTFLSFFLISFQMISQNQNLGEIHGNFETISQYYNEDTIIGAPIVPEKLLMNGFANINYTYGNHFRAGIRYESYLNALQGFPIGYKGTGIPYRFATYKSEELEITVGNYYEQFGSGLILRTYEERGLGYDNVLDGFRVRYTPHKAIHLKALIGKQRIFFRQGEGIVRGMDGEIGINELFKKFTDSKTRINIGGSFVSKYQADPKTGYVLPENVGASSGRLNLTREGFKLEAEYVYKINDPYPTPSSLYYYNYKRGEGLLVSTSYSTKGFGINLSAKRVDNMMFRSERTAISNNLMINYIPAMSKQHTYLLMAFYPYASQPNGEMTFQSEVAYKIKKGTKMGGTYGTEILVNYSGSNGLATGMLNDEGGARKIYTSEFFKPGVVYFRDLAVEINKKFTKKFKGSVSFADQVYNKDVIQGLAGYGNIYSKIAVLDFTYKVKSDKAIRTELQHLATQQDQQSWAAGLIEYTHGEHWFMALLDQYNYGNDDASKRFHYVNASLGYVKNANRITIAYGKQRAGIFCVGGVCRTVPASNGISLSITSSF